MSKKYLRDYLSRDTRQVLISAAIGIYVLLAITILMLAVYGNTAQAKTVFYGKEPVTVRVTAGAPTLFRFDKPVKNILRGDRFTIKPASEDSPNYSVLSVEPRFSTGSSEVLYLLADSETVSVKQVIVPDTVHADSEYSFEAKEEPASATDDKTEGEADGSPEVSLLKSMIRGDQVSGYKITALNRNIDVGIKAQVALIRLCL